MYYLLIGLEFILHFILKLNTEMFLNNVSQTRNITLLLANNV